MPRSEPDTGRSTESARLHTLLVQGLLNPHAYPHNTSGLRALETHASSVILTGEYAYKIKKPVRLPFLDFSLLERRLHFCREELRLNRRFAPGLYLDVVPIGGTPAAPRIGATPAFEYAVKLRQFNPDLTADRALARSLLDRNAVERLAATVATFHAGAARAEAPPADRVARENASELRGALRDAGLTDAIDDLCAAIERDGAKLSPFFAARARDGAVRDGHGDLHLGNVALVDGVLIPFDALEFDAGLRALDVIDEAAFVAMDLAAHARGDLAAAFLTRYLESTGDYVGVRALPFYLRHRALVRAKVGALQGVGGDRAHLHASLAAYLALARRLSKARRPRLIVMYGLSGSGKTTVSSALVGALPALRARSDLERKRLHGLDPQARTSPGIGAAHYDAAANERTYRALETAAGAALDARLDFIVDAACLSRAQRNRFRVLAGRANAKFVIVACTAPVDVLRARVESRAQARSDESEATTAVLEAQRQRAEPPDADDHSAIVEVDTSAPFDTDVCVKAIRAAEGPA